MAEISWVIGTLPPPIINPGSLIVELARGDRRGNNNGGSSKNSRYGPPVRTQYRVVVENLSSSVSWQVNRISSPSLLLLPSWPSRINAGGCFYSQGFLVSTL